MKANTRLVRAVYTAVLETVDPWRFDPRGADGRGRGDRDEHGQRDLDQVERHEDQHALSHDHREGQIRDDGEPGGPGGVDDGEGQASAEEAVGESAAAGGALHRRGGEPRDGGG